TLELYIDTYAVIQAIFHDTKLSVRGYRNPAIKFLDRRTAAPAAVIHSSSKLKHTHIFKSSRASSVRPCNVTSEDSGQSSSSESILLDDEKTLQQKLQIAIDEENYAEAANIRDSLRVLQEDSKTYVLAANGKFYNAFRNGDLATMQTLWARGDNVCCVHPGSSGISSYDHVMSSWEYVWVDYDFPLEIELRDVQVRVKGDVGYVTCVELIRTKGSNWGRQFATNVFERIDGKWLISVHHASPVDL
ncbi:hypothetical protein V2J09_010513, partial [Rumex salicifolius]